MSNIDKYTQFISEQVKSGKIAGLRSIHEEEEKHHWLAHPYTAHESGMEGYVSDKGELSKKGQKADDHYHKALDLIHKHKPAGVKLHSSYGEEDDQMTIKHGSEAHKLVKHLMKHIPSDIVDKKTHDMGDDLH